MTEERPRRWLPFDIRPAVDKRFFKGSQGFVYDHHFLFPHTYFLPFKQQRYRAKNFLRNPRMEYDRPGFEAVAIAYTNWAEARGVYLNKQRRAETLVCSVGEWSEFPLMDKAVALLGETFGWDSIWFLRRPATAYAQERPSSPAPQPSSHEATKGPSTRPEQPAPVAPPGCPMHVPAARDMPGPGLNPLNYIPPLSQEPAPGQAKQLPKERVVSTIPKGPDGQENWVYPSEQMFFNAMRRKGWAPNEEEMKTVVAIHNTTNERTWLMIRAWEKELHPECEPKLLRFRGMPRELSPKARLLGLVGYRAPFDRHDWIIDRCGTEVRYIIDYYDGEMGSKSARVGVHLDVRPALDTPMALVERLRMWLTGGPKGVSDHIKPLETDVKDGDNAVKPRPPLKRGSFADPKS